MHYITDQLKEAIYDSSHVFETAIVKMTIVGPRIKIWISRTPSLTTSCDGSLDESENIKIAADLLKMHYNNKQHNFR